MEKIGIKSLRQRVIKMNTEFIEWLGRKSGSRPTKDRLMESKDTLYNCCSRLKKHESLHVDMQNFREVFLRDISVMPDEFFGELNCTWESKPEDQLVIVTKK